MPRIYTEIRIHHDSEEEKINFEKRLDEQTKKIFLDSRGSYVKHITELDAATGIIEKLKEDKK